MALLRRQHVLVIFFYLKGAFGNVDHAALIHKLQHLGLSGNLMNWFKNFFHDHTFQVCIGNHLSQDYLQVRGVPQGSILSPLLFAIFGIDMPQDDVNECTEYADDISLFSSAASLQEAESKLQPRIGKLVNWCTEWGLMINMEKTKVMHFTTNYKLYKQQHPQIKVNGLTIALTHEYKFLGMIFDGPLLTWKSHIQSLIVSCHRRLNIMKSIAAKNWGADQHTLLQFYKAYILGKLNYGAHIYDSASKSLKAKLDPIQNAALRIITGAYKSTPIVALLGETHCMPLQILRDQKMINVHYKLLSLPEDYSLRHWIVEDRDDVPPVQWTAFRKAPFSLRADDVLQNYQLNLNVSTIALYSIIPPWFYFTNIHFHAHPPPGVSKTLPALNNVNIQTYLNEHFPSYLQIYTDGSHIVTPISSSSAAMYVVQTKQIFAWKVHKAHSVVATELYAIAQALEHANVKGQNAIIMSDSLIGMQMISNMQHG